MNEDLWIAEGVERLALPSAGPLARLADGTLVSAGNDQAWVSRDGGGTWHGHPLFPGAAARQSAEGSLVATRAGTLVLSFLDLSRQSEFAWDPAAHDTPTDVSLPHCTLRSRDGGVTWGDLVTLHPDWTGDARDLIELRDGRLVLTSMRLLHHPGRHSVLTYVSDDDGLTWTASNVIDLGGVGHHGGVTEATVAELGDGRLWLLLRTNWGRFWQAFSEDRGTSWRTIGPSGIAASSAPGILARLASGRLLLVWNRPHPTDGSAPEMLGGDGQFSEVCASNHRRELSAALSEDDGGTWTPPVVVARSLNTDRDHGWLAYPHVLEVRPAVVWLVTMQGGLRVRLTEEVVLSGRDGHGTAGP
ncbi:MAG: sialidase family protein [Candidatus Latescibacterota bacterium]